MTGHNPGVCAFLEEIRVRKEKNRIEGVHITSVRWVILRKNYPP
jgi:hypothetical protein